MQATMAVVEGYSDFVMDGIGAELGPEFFAMRRRLEGRRARRGVIEMLVSRLLGMEMKLSQYRDGRAFCDAVSEKADLQTLNLVWSEPAAMPRPSELREPGRWLARVA
jgi:putative hydrolase